jgi:signal transduction histidine kinase
MVGMMGPGDNISLSNVDLLVLALAGFWLVIATVLAILASRRLRQARSVIAASRSMRDLLEATPARPFLVRPDGAIEIDDRLCRELGVSGQPRSLIDLGNDDAILAEDIQALSTSVADAALSGSAIHTQLRVGESGRVLEVRGGPAPSTEPAGTMLLWLFDASAAEGERAKLSQRLRQTESALDALTHLIEAAPFPMWYRGPDLKLGLVNRAFVDAVEGTDAAEVIARGSELVDAPGPDSARSSAGVALESGRPYERLQPATIRGERRVLRVVNVPLPTGAGAGFAIDVQELEDARADFERHLQSQRDLADRMTAGTAQFDADRNLAFFNQPFAVMTQLDPEWLGEGPEFDRVLDRMREHNRLPETRDFPAWKEERRAWFSSPDEVVEEEWMLAGGDHLRLVAQPLPDGGLRLFLEDRTEQVRLASARDTLLRVRAATFDNLFEAISVFASDGRLYLWNRRFSQVWALDEEWLGKHPRIDEFVAAIGPKLSKPETATKIREAVRLTTNERKPGDGRISMTDGRNFEFALVPLPDGNALLTMVDITDSTRIQSALRERARALEEADRVKTDFVANVSYELRTPLTSIGGFAEMLAGGYAGKLQPAAKEYVDAIVESVTRLARLIDHVLDLTQAGGETLAREEVSIGGLCEAALAAVGAGAAEKGQTLDSDIAESAGSVNGDPRRLQESIEHVLGNAIAYTDPGGKILLMASGDAENAIVTITDNGVGIAEKELPEVFNRFHRIDEAGVRGEAALGLGLPLTRQFIEAHGGKVDLKSKKGKGTTVTLTIPRAAQ